jgi:enterochelin esterase-like enzyme
MRRTIILISLLLLLSCLKREESIAPIIYHGRVEEVSIPPSDPLVELTGEKRALIYLPPGYSEEDTFHRYPFVILLHGYGGNYRFWEDFEAISQIADYLISTFEIEPMILVMPDGFNILGGSFYANSVSSDGQDVFGNFEDYIVRDVVNYVKNHYNVLDSVVHRGIIGISMGGYGALRLGFRHPDIIHAVAGHSGPVAFDEFMVEEGGELVLDQWIKEALIAENAPLDTSGGSTVHIPSPLVHPLPDPERPITSMLFAMAGAFSPEIRTFAGDDTLLLDSLMRNYDFMPVLREGDLYKGVVLPFDSLFRIKMDVWDKWSREADIVGIAEENKEQIVNEDLRIYFDCGEDDELHLAPQAQRLHEVLEELGIQHTFEVFSGGGGFPPDRFPAGHGTHLYLRIGESLKFISNYIKEEREEFSVYPE